MLSEWPPRALLVKDPSGKPSCSPSSLPTACKLFDDLAWTLTGMVSCVLPLLTCRRSELLRSYLCRMRRRMMLRRNGKRNGGLTAGSVGLSMGCADIADCLTADRQ